MYQFLSYFFINLEAFGVILKYFSFFSTFLVSDLTAFVATA